MLVYSGVQSDQVHAIIKRINFGIFGKYIARPDPTWKPEDELWDIEVKTKKQFRVWHWGRDSNE